MTESVAEKLTPQDIDALAHVLKMLGSPWKILGFIVLLPGTVGVIGTGGALRYLAPDSVAMMEENATRSASNEKQIQNLTSKIADLTEKIDRLAAIEEANRTQVAATMTLAPAVRENAKAVKAIGDRLDASDERVAEFWREKWPILMSEIAVIKSKVESMEKRRR